MSWLGGTRARLRLLFARRRAESRTNEEFRFHIEMETERLVREQGLDAREARRRALVAFGGEENHREALRAGRGLAWISGASLDLKLGVRMLVKYPGLTLAGVAGIAVAVAISATAFSVITSLANPALPLPGGDRIIALRNLDRISRNDSRRTHLHDLVTWRAELDAVEAFGAYRTVDRNLIVPELPAEPVRIAEMTASGFRIAGVPPLLGRYVLDDDEREGAPDVVVIGYSLWKSRFGSDSAVIGRTIQLGETRHMVVGVMPEGFAFPIHNRVWTPLRLDPSDYEPGDAPPVEVFGRLAPGATLAEAQSQLTVIGKRLAATHPRTHEHAQPLVLWYTHSFFDFNLPSPSIDRLAHRVLLLLTLLLVIVGTNVAVLVYARTAGRTREIAVRGALGASRSRIVTQLFAEALVLSAAAAAVGLAVARFAIVQINAIVVQEGGEQIPFWMRFELSGGTLLYVAGMVTLTAVIVGALPALKATRRQLVSGLQVGSAGSGMRLGRSWNVMIVAQVAVAVALLPTALYFLAELHQEMSDAGNRRTQGFIMASLHLDRDGAGTDDFEAYDGEEFVGRFARLQGELLDRLAAEPQVSDVVFKSAFFNLEPRFPIEFADTAALVLHDSASATGGRGSVAGIGLVSANYFDVFGIPLVAGRPFNAGDFGPGATAVLVDRSFARKFFGTSSPLGHRVRRIAADDSGEPGKATEPWHEIVGIVGDVAEPVSENELRANLYQPMRPGSVHPVQIAARVTLGQPAAFTGRLRELTLVTSPMLRLRDITTLDDIKRETVQIGRLFLIAILWPTLSVLLLSAAGIYALMSFTVTKRRREIGIRAALGAGSRHVLRGVLSKALGQVATGVAIGIGMALLLDRANHGGLMGGKGILLLPAVAALMAAVGMLATIGPARVALRIQPREALQSE